MNTSKADSKVSDGIKVAVMGVLIMVVGIAMIWLASV